MHVTKKRVSAGRKKVFNRGKPASTRRNAVSGNSKTISARFPQSLLTEASHLRPKSKFSTMMLEAFGEWLQRLRRQHEDEVIARALTSISSKQQNEELKLAGLASRSARRIAGKSNG